MPSCADVFCTACQRLFLGQRAGPFDIHIIRGESQILSACPYVFPFLSRGLNETIGYSRGYLKGYHHGKP